MEERESRLARIVAIAAEVGGAGVGGLLSGSDPASAALAAMTGTALGAVGADIANRTLSPRQEMRVGEVFLQAAASIKAREVMGEKLRDDGFFDGDRSHGHEIAEGVMLAAMDTFEERKVRYLANLLASVAFYTNIDADTANALLRRVDSLTWLELRFLALIAIPEDYPMPDEPPRRATDWNSHTVKHGLRAMADMGGDLMHFRQKQGNHGIALFDLNLSGIALSSTGTLLVDLMELRTIPAANLRPVYDLLLSGDAEEDEGQTTAGSGIADEATAS